MPGCWPLVWKSTELSIYDLCTFLVCCTSIEWAHREESKSLFRSNKTKQSKRKEQLLPASSQGDTYFVRSPARWSARPFHSACSGARVAGRVVTAVRKRFLSRLQWQRQLDRRVGWSRGQITCSYSRNHSAASKASCRIRDICFGWIACFLALFLFQRAFLWACGARSMDPVFLFAGWRQRRCDCAADARWLPRWKFHLVWPGH